MIGQDVLTQIEDIQQSTACTGIDRRRSGKYRVYLYIYTDRKHRALI